MRYTLGELIEGNDPVLRPGDYIKVEVPISGTGRSTFWEEVYHNPCHKVGEYPLLLTDIILSINGVRTEELMRLRNG